MCQSVNIQLAINEKVAYYDSDKIINLSACRVYFDLMIKLDNPEWVILSLWCVFEEDLKP